MLARPVQLIGRNWEESLLLRVAAIAERSLSRNKPARFHAVLN